MNLNMFQFAGVTILGIVLGMIINYLADVLPLTRRLSQPVCAACSQKLTWREYIFATRCSHCQSPYSVRRIVVVILFSAITVLLWVYPPERFNYWVGIGLLVYLAVIFLIDLEYKAILYPTIWAGVVLFFVLGVQLHGFTTTIAGGAAGFLIMLSLHYAGHFFSQWLAKRRGQDLSEPALGFGDVNFAGVIGLVLGWPGILAGLVLAILLGGLFSLIYIGFALLTKQFRMFLAIPYAPFMVIATVYLLFR